MTEYINKAEVVKELERIKKEQCPSDLYEGRCMLFLCEQILYFINTLEVTDPYDQCVQYPTIRDGIKAHAETYSFNIESMLFNQLTKEQQELWRKEIEQAYISGGDSGVEFARDTRYKENLEVKEMDLDKEIKDYLNQQPIVARYGGTKYQLIPPAEKIARYFYILGRHNTRKNK